MKYYCSTIPLTLAEKLKEKGMPMLTSVSISIVGGKNVVDEDGNQWYCPTYAEVFDWLMSRGYRIIIHTKPANEPIIWFAYISTMSPDYCIVGDTRDCDTWHEATNAAIEKTLTLI